MSNRESIYPVEAYTSDVRLDDLRGLVVRHSVRFEIGPNQVMKASDTVGRSGWVVDLYGRASADDAKMKSSAANDHVWDVLSVIAHAVLPTDEGQVAIDIEPYSGRVVVDPKRDFLEEVQLRFIVMMETNARMSMVGDDDTAITDQIADRLAALGARRKS